MEGTMEEKKRIHAYLPLNLYQQLEAFAEQSDRTFTAELIRAIKLYLEHIKREEVKPT
jgi:hypothetical protein